jgi:hypothetical protein
VSNLGKQISEIHAKEDASDEESVLTKLKEELRVSIIKFNQATDEKIQKSKL